MNINVNDEKIKSLLLSENFVTPEDIQAAEAYALEHKVRPVDYLLEQNILTKELLGQAISESLKITFANFTINPPGKELVQRIPENLARDYRVVLFSETPEQVIIASSNPTKPEVADKLSGVFKDAKMVFAYAFPEDIDNAFKFYQKSLGTRFSQIIKDQKRVAPEILDEILADAFAFNASDIHFEPNATEVLIRFRVDGVVQEAGKIPKEYYANVLNRIKVQSNLRIDEHFNAQDGSMHFSRDGYQVDLRTAIIPTVEGEKVTLRVLAAYLQDLSLANIGLSTQFQQILTEASHKPFGMILVTGPTGSGKTTTLYSVLSMLNEPDVNITTIEDPVEYRLPGTNQIQVNSQTDLTFEKGLRSIVRHDPDIILVGEIRDHQTADISVNAALTGHLLLSTLHANDAATAIPRMLEMGTEPFLLASTLEVIVGQRLVRKICSHCRYSVNKSVSDLSGTVKDPERYFGNDQVTLYEGKGCASCSSMGFKGRTAIFEFIQVTAKLQELVLDNPSAQEIWELARSEGAVSMFEDGVEKVKNGVTSIEELLRVVSPPDEKRTHKAKSSHKRAGEPEEVKGDGQDK